MKTPFNIKMSTFRHIYKQNPGKNIFSLFKKLYFDDIDFRGASFIGASFIGASFIGAVGNLRQLKSMQCDRWNIVYSDSWMQIGCERHLIINWFNFCDQRISGMDSSALDWWKIWKPILIRLIDTSPAIPFS